MSALPPTFEYGSHPDIDVPSPRERRRTLRSQLEWLVISICVYVASIGPLYWPWVASVNGFSSRLLQIFYAPLWTLAGLCPPFDRWLQWYIDLWNF